MQPIIRANVALGTPVATDSHAGYNGLGEDYAHLVVNHAERYVDGIIHTNGMENFWSLLKRAIQGTYVGVEPFHLFRYADEQAFRFNERQHPEGDLGRFRKAAKGVVGKRLTYKQLTGKVEADAS